MSAITPESEAAEMAYSMSQPTCKECGGGLNNLDECREGIHFHCKVECERCGEMGAWSDWREPSTGDFAPTLCEKCANADGLCCGLA